MKLGFVSSFPKTSVFIVLAAISSLICLTVYAAVQQSYRSNANDPQIEATEQISALMAQGAPASAIIGQSNPVEVSKSLSLFVMIFDKDGKLAAANAKLGGSDLTLPSGIIDRAKQQGQLRFTWQPQKGVRLAAVMLKADNNSGYVLAGRSLREVESRIDKLTTMLAIAWIAMLALSALLVWALGQAFGQNLTLVENTEVINVEPK